MNKISKIDKMEYKAPVTTAIMLSEASVICMSLTDGTSVESFEEDSDLIW